MQFPGNRRVLMSLATLYRDSNFKNKFSAALTKRAAARLINLKLDYFSKILKETYIKNKRQITKMKKTKISKKCVYYN